MHTATLCFGFPTVAVKSMDVFYTFLAVIRSTDLVLMSAVMGRTGMKLYLHEPNGRTN